MSCSDKHSASATPRVGVEKGDDLVARIEEPLGLMSKAPPVLSQRGQIGANLVVTPDGAATERRQVRPPGDVRIALRQHGLDVSAVTSLVDPLGGGHVLLRHRPRSISQELMRSSRQVFPLFAGSCCEARFPRRRKREVALQHRTSPCWGTWFRGKGV